MGPEQVVYNVTDLSHKDTSLSDGIPITQAPAGRL